MCVFHGEAHFSTLQFFKYSIGALAYSLALNLAVRRLNISESFHQCHDFVSQNTYITNL
jgi:hypothetical protein